jgi:hypothetical protein
VNKIKQILCKIFGHKWVLSFDYVYFLGLDILVKENHCTRCGEFEEVD